MTNVLLTAVLDDGKDMRMRANRYVDMHGMTSCNIAALGGFFLTLDEVFGKDTDTTSEICPDGHGRVTVCIKSALTTLAHMLIARHASGTSLHFNPHDPITHNRYRSIISHCNTYDTALIASPNVDKQSYLLHKFSKHNHAQMLLQSTDEQLINTIQQESEHLVHIYAFKCYIAEKHCESSLLKNIIGDMDTIIALRTIRIEIAKIVLSASSIAAAVDCDVISYENIMREYNRITDIVQKCNPYSHEIAFSKFSVHYRECAIKEYLA